MSAIDAFVSFVNTYLSAFNNVLATIGLLTPVVTVILLLRPLVKPLSVLLKPRGFRMKRMFSVFLACGKLPHVRLRSFIELALVRTEGRHVPPGVWDEIIREFRNDQSKATVDRPVICVNNCSCLTDPGFGGCVSAYLDYFFLPRRRRYFRILQGDVPAFHSVVRIDNAFMMPAALITGLLSRYQDDWKKVIELFVSTTNDVSRDDAVPILPQELCFTYAWLMWGPSYQLMRQDNSYRLLQIAFGDENNSIHGVIRNDEKGDGLWRSLNGSAAGMGEYASIDCTLYSANDYIPRFHYCFGKDARYFLDRFSKQDAESGVILEIEDIDRKKSSVSRNYYCTAYLWILFEAVDPGRIGFQPSKVVAFFEHANLANAENFDFLVDCLIAKCFDHFRTIFACQEYDGRKYRYCLASNTNVEERFAERYAQRVQAGDRALAERVAKDPVRSATTVFRSIDDFFTRSIGDYRILEASAGDEESLSLLGRFYTETYSPAFEDENERETLDNVVEYLKKKRDGWYGRNNYHVILCVDADDDVLGGAICDYFASGNLGVVEFIAVNKKYRVNGYGTRLYESMLELLHADAKRAGRKRMDWVFCEIEDPGTVKTGDPAPYLYFWEKMNFSRLAFRYIQPALSRDKRPVESLWLIALYLGRDDGNSGVPKPILRSFLCDYARYAMRIDNAQEDPALRAMLGELEEWKAEDIALEGLNEVISRFGGTHKQQR